MPPKVYNRSFFPPLKIATSVGVKRTREGFPSGPKVDTSPGSLPQTPDSQRRTIVKKEPTFTNAQVEEFGSSCDFSPPGETPLQIFCRTTVNNLSPNQMETLLHYVLSNNPNFISSTQQKAAEILNSKPALDQRTANEEPRLGPAPC